LKFPDKGIDKALLFDGRSMKQDRFVCQGKTCNKTQTNVEALVKTGQFKVVSNLVCPDSGEYCKGLQLI